MVSESTDPLAGLRELQRSAESLRSQYAAGEKGAGQRISGSDEEGLVEVTLTASGEIEEIVLDPDWRDAYGEENLGANVLAALRAAQTQRLAEWADGVKEAEGSSDSPAATGSLAGESLIAEARPGRPTSAAAVAEAHRLAGMLREVRSQVTAMSQAMGALGSQGASSTSPDRAVTVTMTGGNIASIELDERWVRNSGDGQVARAIRDALRSASSAHADRKRDVLDQFPELKELRNLAADPTDLFRRLGSIA